MEIQIRKMTMDDLGPLHRLLSDPETMRYLEPPFSMEQTEKFLAEAGLGDPPLVYAVMVRERFAGYIIYHPYDKGSMEIGWVLLPEYRGKGYASELTRILSERAQREGKQAVIECVPEQKVSKRIAEKNGFTYCGRTDGLDVYRRY